MISMTLPHAFMLYCAPSVVVLAWLLRKRIDFDNKRD